jgi:DNA-binding LacI/PurR family transcriptional regulator
MRSVTQEDVARRCGVSRSTVSLVFRENPQIPVETASRIRTVAAELGYSPASNQAARRLIARRYQQRILTHTVLLLLPDFYHRALYFSHLVEGIQDELMAAGFLSLICTPGTLASARKGLLPPLLASGDYDGVLVFGGLGANTEAQHVIRHANELREIPVITLLGDPPTVRPDEYTGMLTATRHLLALGHRHLLCCLSPWGADFWAERLRGVQAAYAEQALDPDTYLHAGGWYFGNLIPPHHLEVTDLTFASPGEERFVTGQFDAFSRYLAAHPEITAILAQNDPLARRLAYALKRLGKEVPRDISLVAFDDTDPLLDAEGRNMLTTVRVPLAEIGADAARRLVAWIHGTRPAEPTTLPTELVVRGSTAAVDIGATGTHRMP